jgi:hypothetical protein
LVGLSGGMVLCGFCIKCFCGVNIKRCTTNRLEGKKRSKATQRCDSAWMGSTVEKGRWGSIPFVQVQYLGEAERGIEKRG